MELLSELLPIIIYVLLVILLVVLIVIAFKVLKTMNKVERVVDDVETKVSSLNNFFKVLSFTTDKIAGFSDSIVNKITSLISNIFSRKKGEEDE